MNAVYLDTTVVLRFVFRQPNSLDVRRLGAFAVGSELLRVECLRIFDRLRLQSRIGAAEAEIRRAALDALLDAVGEIALSRAILRRAAGPLPGPLGTLNAIHLASALMFRELRHQDEVAFATHDRALGAAASLHGFRVLGLPE